MSAQTMTKSTAAFLTSEANGYRSREAVTVTISADDVSNFPNGIPAGLVLGKVTSSGKYERVDPGLSPDTGEATAAGILLEDLPATAGDVTATVIVRDAEVVASKLTHSDYSPDNTSVETASLASLGIIAR